MSLWCLFVFRGGPRPVGPCTLPGPHLTLPITSPRPVPPAPNTATLGSAYEFEGGHNSVHSQQGAEEGVSGCPRV